MNGDERGQLEVLRAEMNGKLDVVIERTSHLVDTAKDHEVRLRKVEETQQESEGETRFKKYAAPVLLTFLIALVTLHTFLDLAAT